ncbi:hypothetical protein CISIN_1g0370511mg, partial [Citrus sinensis]
SSSRTVVGHVKLKSLHWDKVATNVDHSMVWNEINDGSLRFDDEQIENLFGYSTINRRLYERSKTSMSSGSSNAAPTAELFILEPRKCQNTAIVLRSLAISQKEIIEALLDGQGLSIDILEKLAKLSSSQDDANTFLFHILKVIPSAFTRVNAMLFRSNYKSEILQLKESLQALEMGYNELRTRVIFLKLLEAILKAGNKMNAGTSRGNAQRFNLSALRKLSDVKSTNGKTTLLYFVVEQRDNKYLKQRLPAVEGLSNEFNNVNKAVRIELDTFINTYSALASRVVEIWELVTHCASSEKGGFLKEMKGLLEECKEELKLVRNDQNRTMELVKRTTKYYQAGGSKEKWGHPLQLFVIVKEFLDMVDTVCADISRNLQKKNGTTSVASSPPL